MNIHNMNNVKTYILLLFSLCALQVGAQSMEELLVSMPQGVTPYLTENQKKEMVESLKIGVSTSVQNQLHGTSTLDTLTADYCRVSLSSARELQLVRLLRTEGDSIVCLIDTYRAPQADSRVSFFTLAWRPINEALMPEVTLDELTLRPDTMSVSQFDSLRTWLDPVLVALTYDLDEHCLVASLSLPYSPTDEKESLEAILCERRLRWNGYFFEKCY